MDNLTFDFGTYNGVKNAINSANIMQITMIGGQAVAGVFVIIKLLHNFTKDTFGGERKINNILETFGLIFLITIVPYTMDIIDNTFASVENQLSDFKGSGLPTTIKENFKDMFLESTDSILTIFSLGFTDFLFGTCQLALCLVGFLIWAIDSAIFAIFVIERLILVELYRFLFPLMIAFVGIDGLRNTYFKWVTSFIGIMLLPIPYIAVHTAIETVNNYTINLNKSDNEIINLLFTIVILIASAGMKYKLLSSISSKVSNIL